MDQSLSQSKQLLIREECQTKLHGNRKFARERYHSSIIDIEQHKEATAFGFGIHQFANKVCSLVLGWK